nr:hypothetical protein [Candidatus Aenigmarchaeota archaeon]
HGEIEKYNCPKHGESCELDCPYLRQWLEKFDWINRLKEYRKLGILDVSNDGKYRLIEDPEEGLKWVPLPS